jgi:tetratricopeptide (TPR) repeat protein
VNRLAIVLAVLAAASIAMPCAAQSPGKRAPGAIAPAAAGGVTITPSAPAAVGNVEEGQKVAEIQAVLAAGEFDKAIEAANVFLRTARDETSKTEALRTLAEAYRKKGDWRQAAPAYQRLRDRFEKGSENWMKYDGIAEILRASPAGVYQPAGVTPAKAPAAPAAGGQTLSDDAALAEALTRLAGYRSSRLKTRVATITRATTPQLVVAAFAPVAEEARQVFVLSADAPPDGPREVCTAAGNRLQTLGTQIIASLKNKLDKLQPKMVPYSGAITNQDKADIKSTQAACKELVEAESKFQQALMTAGGRGDWPDQDRLRKESADRRSSYEQLGNQFIIPPSLHYGYGY